MADLNFGGTEEENPELKKLNAEVLEDPDSYERWEKLVRAAENLEGGLTRNSSPLAISSARRVYDAFLSKFPLFFGYWKKYADLEFAISGTEAADMVYERGVASISCSVDLWQQYCTFKMDTSHDPDAIRELFERGASSVGLDFLSHPFWDKYLEFEERNDAYDNIFAILGRLILIPMHQYARYFERFRQMAQSRPINELCPSEDLVQYRAEIEMEAGQNAKSEYEIEADLRRRTDQSYVDKYHRCHTETTKRWTFEQEIKRPYFHVTDLEDSQLENWKKYLDFEEAEGDFARIVFLYERCLVATAYYDEFWLRYARWMRQNELKVEEIRNIYLRACCFFAPISRPAVRLQYALFEESNGRVSVAHDVYESILMSMPSNTEIAIAWASSVRRHEGVEASIGVYNKLLESTVSDATTKAVLIGELATLIAKFKGATDEARELFKAEQQNFVGSFEFWKAYLVFEIEHPPKGTHKAPSDKEQQEQYDRVRDVFNNIRNRSQLSVESIKNLALIYSEYLLHGPKEVAKEWLSLDRDLNGLNSVDQIHEADSPEVLASL